MGKYERDTFMEENTFRTMWGYYEIWVVKTSSRIWDSHHPQAINRFFWLSQDRLGCHLKSLKMDL